MGRKSREYGPNGKSLVAGQYEKGKWGGAGYWGNYHDELAGKDRLRWTWVTPPKGFRVVNGELVRDTMPDPKNIFNPGTFVGFSSAALDNKKDGNG